MVSFLRKLFWFIRIAVYSINDSIAYRRRASAQYISISFSTSFSSLPAPFTLSSLGPPYFFVTHLYIMLALLYGLGACMEHIPISLHHPLPPISWPPSPLRTICLSYYLSLILLFLLTQFHIRGKQCDINCVCDFFKKLNFITK